MPRKINKQTTTKSYTSFLKDKDGNISSRILFITTNTILTWVIVFICVFKNIDIQTGVLTLLITLTAKSGVDSIGQVYQNVKENKNIIKN